MWKLAQEMGGSNPSLGEGDGEQTSSQTPDSYDSGMSGHRGYGKVPQVPQRAETFGAAFEEHAHRSPFFELLISRIKEKKEQEKQSMEISPQMMRAFQDEIGHLRQEKQAFLGAIGKGLIGAGLKAGTKGGLLQRGTRAISRGARRVAGSREGGRKLIGGAALATGSAAALGTGAALS